MPRRERRRPEAATAGAVRRSWATLLRTRKRDGSWVGTPVNLAVEGDRAYFGTPAKTAKVKRLRNFDAVELAPCTVRGRPTGAAIAARARRLEGEESKRRGATCCASTGSLTASWCRSSCG